MKNNIFLIGFIFSCIFNLPAQNKCDNSGKVISAPAQMLQIRCCRCNYFKLKIIDAGSLVPIPNTKIILQTINEYTITDSAGFCALPILNYYIDGVWLNQKFKVTEPNYLSYSFEIDTVLLDQINVIKLVSKNQVNVIVGGLPGTYGDVNSSLIKIQQ